MSNLDIRALREKLDWTQAEMADYLGVDRSTVSRMENGQSQPKPVAKLLAALAAKVPSDPEQEAAE